MSNCYDGRNEIQIRRSVFENERRFKRFVVSIFCLPHPRRLVYLPIFLTMRLNVCGSIVTALQEFFIHVFLYFYIDFGTSSYILDSSRSIK